MQVIINNKVATVKAGSFEYVSENRLFGGGDDYTFAITLPLAGCTQNQQIFGNICRTEVVPNKIRFDCEIRCRDFSKFGTATITEITESEVKIQFLAGRSEQNFDDTWDKVYINELNLGYNAIVSASQIDPSTAWDPEAQNLESVALPWVNNNSDSGLPHNFADYSEGKYVWSDTTKILSWQPYLLFITKKICEAVGYNCDLTEWEAKKEFKYLLICNCLPDAWDLGDYARALPHWTVDEYFEKLELFLFGEFEIDHREKTIKFRFTSNLLAEKPVINIESVVDSYSTTIKDKESKCEYIETQNIVYKSCDMNIYKYYMCDEFIKNWKGKIASYDTLSELMSDNLWLRTYLGSSKDRGTNYSALLYAKDVDAYFVIRAVDRRDNPDPDSSIKYQYRCIIQPLNFYGGRIVDDSDDAEQKEIEFIPVAIDFTEDKYGDAIFLNPSGYDEEDTSNSDDSTATDDGQEIFRKTWMQSTIDAYDGEDDKTEYYSEIFIGWWDGVNRSVGHLPHPYAENIVISPNWDGWRWLNYNIRLNDKSSSRGKVIYHIDTTTKTTFKFLADSIPDVRSVFLIRGRRYICEKITATISEDGLSQLMKGEFWPLID